MTFLYIFFYQQSPIFNLIFFFYLWHQRYRYEVDINYYFLLFIMFFFIGLCQEPKMTIVHSGRVRKSVDDMEDIKLL